MTVTIYKLVSKKETKSFPFQFFEIMPIEISGTDVTLGQVFTDEARKWEYGRGGFAFPKYGWNIRKLQSTANELYKHLEDYFETARESDNLDREYRNFTLKKNYYNKLIAKYRWTYGYEPHESIDLPSIEPIEKMYEQLLPDENQW